MTDQKGINYRALAKAYGVMYHLLVLTKTEVKFASSHNKPKYAGLNGNPIFIFDNEVHEAIDYVIVYPKLYVTTSMRLVTEDASSEQLDGDIKNTLKNFYIH